MSYYKMLGFVQPSEAEIREAGVEKTPNFIAIKKTSSLQICMSFAWAHMQHRERCSSKVLSPLKPISYYFAWVKSATKNATLKYMKSTIIIVHSHLMLSKC
jgi:hypothetical protein